MLLLGAFPGHHENHFVPDWCAYHLKQEQSASACYWWDINLDTQTLKVPLRPAEIPRGQASSNFPGKLYMIKVILQGIRKILASLLHYLFPWCLSGKEHASQCRRHRFDSWVRKIPWRRKWQPTPVFLPGKSHRQRRQSMGLHRVRHIWAHPHGGVQGVTECNHVPCFLCRTPESILETFLPEWHSGRNWNAKLLTGIWKMFILSWNQSAALWPMEEYVLGNCIAGFKHLPVKDEEIWDSWLSAQGFSKPIPPHSLPTPNSLFQPSWFSFLSHSPVSFSFPLSLVP